ncbi:DUF726 family protein [Schizosaccharomyces japonicus yFS275]|uniref:DUF726 family protein n=1 Tax=Schizosaccharomyces japonicus (strain yFS275 / FY16936) TaxID=402676 RepID=B6K0Z7_SCHJY|nr:DUF726 family protein [Schizosaccharomyces japonicus yFS275]EEB07618.1 DUF726 family protein [Schizosaccharomyces japonicus yFS275]
MAEALIELFSDDDCTRYTIFIAESIARLQGRFQVLTKCNGQHLRKQSVFTATKNCLKAFDQWALRVVQKTGKVLDPALREHHAVKPKKEKEKPTKAQELSREQLDECFIKCLLLMLLSLEEYTSLSRALLFEVSGGLQLPVDVVYKAEMSTTSLLLETFKQLEADQSVTQMSRKQRIRRRVLIGVSGLAGGAILGLTGGLAAPLVVTGLGTLFAGLGLSTAVGATCLGTLATSIPFITTLFGGFGAKMGVEHMRNISRGLNDFMFVPLSVESRLPVTLCVSGWLTEYNDFSEPWVPLFTGPKSFVLGDAYALRFEVGALLKLGKTFSELMYSTSLNWVKYEVLRRTFASALMTALWPVALVKLGRVVNNPWRVAFNLAEKAGVALANALCQRAQGQRPVTLIGYSLGARVISRCLLCLAERGEHALVENAILLGAPVPTDWDEWFIMRSVIVGRLVNVYSTHDYILRLVYRTQSIQASVAGLEPVEKVPLVENIDVSDMVEGHLQYRWSLLEILKDRVRLPGITSEDVKKAGQVSAQMEAREKEQYAEKKEHVFFNAEVNQPPPLPPR